ALGGREAGAQVQPRGVGQLLTVVLGIVAIGGPGLEVHEGVVGRGAARAFQRQVHHGPGFGGAVVGGAGVAGHAVAVVQVERAAGLALGYAHKETLAQRQHGADVAETALVETVDPAVRVARVVAGKHVHDAVQVGTVSRRYQAPVQGRGVRVAHQGQAGVGGRGTAVTGQRLRDSAVVGRAHEVPGLASGQGRARGIRFQREGVAVGRVVAIEREQALHTGIVRVVVLRPAIPHGQVPEAGGAAAVEQTRCAVTGHDRAASGPTTTAGEAIESSVVGQAGRDDERVSAHAQRGAGGDTHVARVGRRGVGRDGREAVAAGRGRDEGVNRRGAGRNSKAVGTRATRGRQRLAVSRALRAIGQRGRHYRDGGGYEGQRIGSRGGGVRVAGRVLRHISRYVHRGSRARRSWGHAEGIRSARAREARERAVSHRHVGSHEARHAFRKGHGVGKRGRAAAAAVRGRAAGNGRRGGRLVKRVGLPGEGHVAHAGREARRVGQGQGQGAV
nr:hypothetical protein [Tanacetum cinerariifolium]